MSRITKTARVLTLREDGSSRRRDDVLAAEEPLEIRVVDRPFSVTMRTPGDDFDLVAGFLVSEGIVSRAEHLPSMIVCAGERPGDSTYNVIDAHLAPGVPLPDLSLERHVYTTSSCGICGTASIEAVTKSSHFPSSDDPSSPSIELATLLALPDRLRAEQAAFERTGGVHAAGLFSLDGELLCLREDVGRHNAVDKVVGWALREDRLPLRDTVLQVSGRASFELVQKCHMAGIPIMSAVSAPSSLAVDLAREVGLTLAGFSRGRSVNVYAGALRVRVPQREHAEAGVN
ncbi:formate dehydrogenase accessory sulfurtransferase FdhD [Pseudoclavibacter chungangensis]|uniref:Sulfur carrier protein FdhD n=1 Tax=Pseudoclavibacter chungangensis TaxID=587635 RepID=A0A7J5BQ14_9MICO|nr:formate dehydrogenase accessory sulfurtransferase FdhD [Pseudoclavibacter chungangensis]KAB1655638.1 formate dehydrogenase accessory sulfurtransferase FdhD [Pseudoclavibacter chungangensis]NYJ67961.1 FdhD protein [Pseudoclavibacter chungangensis]